MTIIYLMRHSHPLYIDTNDIYQIRNEKFPLSIAGEKLAQKVAKEKVFKDLDIIIVSDYVRSICTGKYFSKTGNNIQSMSEFNERKFGVDDFHDIPDDFYLQQIQDENYKFPNGESRREVTLRMLKGIKYLLDNYTDKKILVVGHSTAIYHLLMHYCSLIDNQLFYNENMILKDRMGYCSTIKLQYDNNDLISVKNIL